MIKIYEFFDTKNYVYIVLELCNGGELFQQIQKFKNFKEMEAKKIFHTLLYTMNYIQNKGIMHRDLKPENIMIDEKNWILKIVDFGASEFFTEEENFFEKFGTPYYIAPEVLSNRYNYKCDNWSLGVILYVLISGKPPFYGSN